MLAEGRDLNYREIHSAIRAIKRVANFFPSIHLARLAERFERVARDGALLEDITQRTERRYSSSCRVFSRVAKRYPAAAARSSLSLRVIVGHRVRQKKHRERTRARGRTRVVSALNAFSKCNCCNISTLSVMIISRAPNYS